MLVMVISRGVAKVEGFDFEMDTLLLMGKRGEESGTLGYKMKDRDA